MKKLKMPEVDWLPPSLLETALADADDLTKAGARWTLKIKPSVELQCVLPDGSSIVGSFQLQRGQVVRAGAVIANTGANGFTTETRRTRSSK